MLDPALAQQIWDTIHQSQHILLHFHPNPDGDSIGSSLGLAHALREQGKRVTVISGDSEIPDYLRHLPGVDTVVQHPYPSFDLAENQVDLFLILDSASPTQISRQAEVTFPENIETIVIDHHGTNTGFADINWIDPTSPATCQMVYELIVAGGYTVSAETAQCLFVGLFTDTGGFQYPPTSGKTLRIAADLADIYPNFSQLLFPIQNSFSPQHIAYQTVALQNLRLFPLANGRQLAMSVVSYQDMERLHLTPEFADKSDIANKLKSVVGWDVAVALVEIEPGRVGASFRTRDSQKYHVGNIAAALGGGGHPAAAGLMLHSSLDEAIRQVAETVQGWKG